MPSQEVIDLVKQYLKNGMQKSEISRVLQETGFSKDEVEEVMKEIGEEEEVEKIIEEAKQGPDMSEKFNEEEQEEVSAKAKIPGIALGNKAVLENGKFARLNGNQEVLVEQKTDESSQGPAGPSVVSFQPKPRGRAKKIILGVVFALVLLGGAGVFAYFEYFEPPKIVMEKMFEKAEGVSSYKYSGNALLEIKAERPPSFIFEPETGSDITKNLGASLFSSLGRSVDQADSVLIEEPPYEAQGIKLSFNFDGSVDKSIPESPKSSFYFGAKTEEFSIGALLPVGPKPSLWIEGRNISKVSYVRFGIMNLGMDPIDNYDSGWVTVDLEELASVLGNKEEMEKQAKLQEERNEKIKQAFLDNNPIVVKEKLEDEKINGKSCFHYLLALDKAKLKELFGAVYNIYSEELSDLSSGADKMYIDEISEAIDEAKNLPEFEIWVAKREYLPYKIAFSNTFSEEGVSGKVGVYVELRDYNKPVILEAPADSKPLMELEIFKGLIGAQDRAKDARIMSDMSQLRTIATVIHGEDASYSAVCSDNELNLSEENYRAFGIQSTKIIRDDIEAQGGNVQCFASKTSYCIETFLNSGGYYCMDSDLKAGKADLPNCKSADSKCDVGSWAYDDYDF